MSQNVKPCVFVAVISWSSKLINMCRNAWFPLREECKKRSNVSDDRSPKRARVHENEEEDHIPDTSAASDLPMTTSDIPMTTSEIPMTTSDIPMKTNSEENGEETQEFSAKSEEESSPIQVQHEMGGGYIALSCHFGLSLMGLKQRTKERSPPFVVYWSLLDGRLQLPLFGTSLSSVLQLF